MKYYRALPHDLWRVSARSVAQRLESGVLDMPRLDCAVTSSHGNSIRPWRASGSPFPRQLPVMLKPAERSTAHRRLPFGLQQLVHVAPNPHRANVIGKQARLQLPEIRLPTVSWIADNMRSSCSTNAYSASDFHVLAELRIVQEKVAANRPEVMGRLLSLRRQQMAVQCRKTLASRLTHGGNPRLLPDHGSRARSGR